MPSFLPNVLLQAYKISLYVFNAPAMSYFSTIILFCLIFSYKIVYLGYVVEYNIIPLWALGTLSVGSSVALIDPSFFFFFNHFLIFWDYKMLEVFVFVFVFVFCPGPKNHFCKDYGSFYWRQYWKLGMLLP